MFSLFWESSLNRLHINEILNKKYKTTVLSEASAFIVTL